MQQGAAPLTMRGVNILGEPSVMEFVSLNGDG
jgi:hypothetical protein